MNEQEDRMVTEAAAWHAASRDDAMDWDGFTLWLERDPRHAGIYDSIALTDAMLDDHRNVLVDAARPQPCPAAAAHRPFGPLAKRAGLAGLAVAASLAAVMVVSPRLTASPKVYATRAQVQRIVLEDGSQVTLAPHSRLAVSASDRTRMTLIGGAWFEVVHDPARTMSIAVGPLEIRDIGTSFDVQAQTGAVRVGVAEGQVTVSSPALAQPIQLARGRGLTFDGAQGTALVTSRSPASIGAWRAGRLFYEGTPLPLVLADLSRYAGIEVSLPDGLRNRQFAGSLIVNDGEAAIRDLAQVMDLDLSRDSGGFHLRERNR